MGNESAENAVGIERLAYFSDAVFAISITLLSTSTTLPVHLTQRALINWILGLHPHLLAYAIGYITIGVYWLTHYRMFYYIKRGDAILRKFNLLFLISITTIPFLANFIVNYHHLHIAIVLYAFAQIIISLFSVAIWGYASHNHRLIDPALDQKTIRGVTVRDIAPATIFLISIIIALFNNAAAQFFWLCVALVPFVSRQWFPQQRGV